MSNQVKYRPKTRIETWSMEATAEEHCPHCDKLIEILVRLRAIAESRPICKLSGDVYVLKAKENATRLQKQSNPDNPGF